METGENKQFNYKKDKIDWLIVGIIGFTIFVFVFIFVIMPYLERSGYVGSDEDSYRQELIEQRSELQRQIRELEVES